MTSTRERVLALFRRQESDNLGKSLVAGATGTVVLNLGALAANFAGLVLLTRFLGTQGYGTYVYALAWAALFGVPAMIGLPQIVVREVAVAHARRELGLVRGIIRRAYQWTCAASAAVMTVGAAGAVLVGRHEPAVRRAYLVALLVIPVVALYRISESVLRGFRRVVQGRVAETLVQPVLLIVLLLAARSTTTGHLGASAAVALTLAAAAIALLVSLVLVGRAVPDTVRRARPAYTSRTWWRSAAPLLVHSGAAATHVQVSPILIGVFDGVASSGVFNTAVRWAAFVAFIQTAVNYPLAPAIARLHEAGERDRMQALLLRSSRGATALALPVAIGVVAFREPALRIFGADFGSAGPALAILVLGELISVASGSTIVALAMTGHERVMARTSVTAAALNLALGLALIPSVGITGAAIARTLSLAWLQLALLGRLRRLEGISSAVGGNRLLERLSSRRPRLSKRFGSSA